MWGGLTYCRNCSAPHTLGLTLTPSEGTEWQATCQRFWSGRREKDVIMSARFLLYYRSVFSVYGKFCCAIFRLVLLLYWIVEVFFPWKEKVKLDDMFIDVRYEVFCILLLTITDLNWRCCELTGNYIVMDYCVKILVYCDKVIVGKD